MLAIVKRQRKRGTWKMILKKKDHHGEDHSDKEAEVEKINRFSVIMENQEALVEEDLDLNDYYYY